MVFVEGDRMDGGAMIGVCLVNSDGGFFGRTAPPWREKSERRIWEWKEIRDD